MEYPIFEIEHLDIWGRTGREEDSLMVFFTGSGIELNVKAKELFVTIEAAFCEYELWADILIEGELSQRFPLLEGTHTYQVFRGFDGEKEVNVRIFRDTQVMAEEERSVFRICSLKTDGEFLPVKKHEYLLEVIGDSITSGEGCGVSKREEWVSAIFDAIHSYPYLLAEHLDAKYQVMSLSGWGLVASWDGDEQNSIPGYYNQICGMMRSCERCKKAGAHSEWDFEAHQPDAVIINLGTNDGSAMSSRPEKWTQEEYVTLFKEKAVRFLKNIREKNRKSRIVWAYGMLGNVMEEDIKEAIKTYQKETGDAKVFCLALPDCGNRKGVREHPDREAHREAAEILERFLQ